MDMNQAVRAMANLKSNAYGVEITLDNTAGADETASVVINRRDFAIRKLKYVVVGDDGTDAQSFGLDFSLQNEERFFKDVIPLAPIYGSAHHGIWHQFEPAIQVPEQTTIYIRVINRYAVQPAAPMVIQVFLEGAELKKKGETI